jgi:hypothetical protein
MISRLPQALSVFAMQHFYPTYYGETPPIVDELDWEQTRPDDTEYWRRVHELQWRGGFWASARLAWLHNKPDEEPLLAIVLEPLKGEYFPNFMLHDALKDTRWEGVPTHLSLCFQSECPPRLLRGALRRWRERGVWVECRRVTSGATCEVGGRLAECPVLQKLHNGGYYKDRALHVSL